MAIDPKAPPESELASPIENELPAYRAISPAAIASLCLGVLAGLSFVEEVALLGLVAAVAAIVVGAYADRQIRRMSDVLTGRGFAQAGIALGLACGLSSQTYAWVNDMLVRREATAFAKRYIAALETTRLDEPLYLQVPPGPRKEMTPEQALAKRRGGAGGREEMMFRTEVVPIQGILNRLKEPGTHLEFRRIEAVFYDKMTPMTAVLMELHGPVSPKHPADEYVLAELKADPEMRRGPARWYVGETRYPYIPKTYVAPVKPVDDGHGHAH